MKRTQSTLQADILVFARGYYDERSKAPAASIIARVFDIRAKTALRHIDDLCKAGEWPKNTAPLPRPHRMERSR
jgi:hypothetical protein